jgi:hypothetical protein
LQEIHLVTKKQTAVRITQAILFEKYGEKNITKQQPYELYQIYGCWVVFGTLPKYDDGGTFK